MASPVGTHNFNCQALILYPTPCGYYPGEPDQTLDFPLDPPATITGIVYNFDSGDPIIGAKVSTGGAITYSIAGGTYTLENVWPGTVTINAEKPGFDNFSFSAQ